MKIVFRLRPPTIPQTVVPMTTLQLLQQLLRGIDRALIGGVLGISLIKDKTLSYQELFSSGKCIYERENDQIIHAHFLFLLLMMFLSNVLIDSGFLRYRIGENLRGKWGVSACLLQNSP